MVSEIWSVTGQCLSFYPFKNLQNQQFKKMKKVPGGIINLRFDNTNENCTMYGSWDIVRNGETFFVILDQRLSFYPSKTWKIKILKTWKKCRKILSFFICVPQMTIIWYVSWDMRRDRIFCHFEPFFALLPTTIQKIKILKHWK